MSLHAISQDDMEECQKCWGRFITASYIYLNHIKLTFKDTTHSLAFISNSKYNLTTLCIDIDLHTHTLHEIYKVMPQLTVLNMLFHFSGCMLGRDVSSHIRVQLVLNSGSDTRSDCCQDDYLG